MGIALNLYENDFFAWTQEQAKLIKAKAFDKLDMIHLFEEVESMGASEVRGLENRLEILLIHLLKWEHQPGFRGKSWQLTIKEQRNRIKRRLKKMPALKSQLNEAFIDSYADAIYGAAKETGLDETSFPQSCAWSVEQVLDDSFLPN